MLLSFRLLYLPFLWIQQKLTYFVPSSPVSNVIVTAFLTVISDGEFDVLHAALAKEVVDIAVNVHLVQLSHYRYVKVWMSKEQIADPSSQLSDMPSSYVKN